MNIRYGNVDRDIKEAKLIDIESYQDNDRWYLRLVFEYTKLNGDKYQLEIPKMCLPLSQFALPDFVYSSDYFDTNAYALTRDWCVDGFRCICLDKGHIKKIADISEESACCYAIKQVSKQMTIEEIEKELGYKVNIVDKH